MYDRRVVRGNTFGASVIPVGEWYISNNLSILELMTNFSNLNGSSSQGKATER